MQLDIDLDEIWPPASALLGVQFETDADFARCRAILWEHPDTSMGMDAEARYVVVRKSDVHLFSDAGLAFGRVEFVELDELPPLERYELERKMIERLKPRFHEWLRGRQ